MISEVDIKDWEMLGQFPIKDMPDNSVFSLVRENPYVLFMKIHSDEFTTLAKSISEAASSKEFFGNSALGFLWQKK